MISAAEHLLQRVRNRPLLIWGARMTGIGFLRFARSHGFHPLAFIDSDPSLTGKHVCDLRVCAPSEVPSFKRQHPNLVILIAVSIKEDEIVATLRGMGLSSRDYVCYNRYCRHFFTIDVAGICNLRCPSCVHCTSIDGGPRGFMPEGDFRRIIQKMLRETPLVSHVCLYSWGEPFLHPQLPSFIDLLHAHGIAAAVSTNLSIRSAQRIHRIIQSSPDYLKISVSGYYPGVYSSTHTGGDVSLVKTNLRRIREYINRSRAITCVEINYHLYRNNIGADLVRMRNLSERLGFLFSTCYANITPVERLIDYCEGRVDPSLRRLLPNLLVGIDAGLAATRRFRHLPCRFLSNQVNINWDRSVPLCCVCFERASGQVSADYLKEPLSRIERKRQKHPVCRRCHALGIPPYLLGVNQKGWNAEADRTIQTSGNRQ